MYGARNGIRTRPTCLEGRDASRWTPHVHSFYLDGSWGENNLYISFSLNTRKKLVKSS